MHRLAFLLATLIPATMFGKSLGLNLCSFSVKDGKGSDHPLSQYKNVPAVLIVNVASHCGYTDSHYRELQALRAEYSEDQLAIVAFPCNQFGAQEPGTWDEIVSFASGRYGATFPIMGKVNVNGLESDPLFAWLKAASGNPVDIPWNFTKFLVVCGEVVRRYSHEVSVLQVEHDISSAQGSCPEKAGEL